jgi:Lrp/AsnC family leucine-responsive transcriptional regulator
MLDEVSLEILKILQEKARIPNVEVSRQIGLAPSAVLERIRKLESNGFIDGYEVRLNPEKFNRRSVAFVHVMVQMPIDPSIGETLSRIPEVQEVHFVSGRDSYLLKIRTEDEASLYRILSEQVSTVRGVISTRTETVLTTIKETNRIQLPTSL